MLVRLVIRLFEKDMFCHFVAESENLVLKLILLLLLWMWIQVDNWCWTFSTTIKSKQSEECPFYGCNKRFTTSIDFGCVYNFQCSSTVNYWWE